MKYQFHQTFVYRAHFNMPKKTGNKHHNLPVSRITNMKKKKPTSEMYLSTKVKSYYQLQDMQCTFR